MKLITHVIGGASPGQAVVIRGPLGQVDQVDSARCDDLTNLLIYENNRDRSTLLGSERCKNKMIERPASHDPLVDHPVQVCRSLVCSDTGIRVIRAHRYINEVVRPRNER